MNPKKKKLSCCCFFFTLSLCYNNNKLHYLSNIQDISLANQQMVQLSFFHIVLAKLFPNHTQKFFVENYILEHFSSKNCLRWSISNKENFSMHKLCRNGLHHAGDATRQSIQVGRLSVVSNREVAER